MDIYTLANPSNGNALTLSSVLPGVFVLLAGALAIAVQQIAHFGRVRAGHFIPTISTALKIQRTRGKTNSTKAPEDDLIVLIDLKKEEESQAVKLKGLSVEIFQLKREALRAPCGSVFDGHRYPNPENRSLDSVGERVSKRHVLAIWTTQEKRPLNLAPREATQYASYHVVQTDEVYEAVVTLTAVRYRSWITRPFFREDRPKDLLFYTSSIISAELTAEA